MMKMKNFIEPGAITRIYDVSVKEVISAVSTRQLPSQMHDDGLVYVDADGLSAAAEKLNWKMRQPPEGSAA